MVEYNLAKVKAEGSSPFLRKKNKGTSDKFNIEYYITIIMLVILSKSNASNLINFIY